MNECSADGWRTYSVSGGGGGGLLERFLAVGLVSDIVAAIDEVVWNSPARALKRALGRSAWSRLLSLSDVLSLLCCR